jgi:hypothetical protein
VSCSEFVYAQWKFFWNFHEIKAVQTPWLRHPAHRIMAKSQTSVSSYLELLTDESKLDEAVKVLGDAFEWSEFLVA